MICNSWGFGDWYRGVGGCLGTEGGLLTTDGDVNTGATSKGGAMGVFTGSRVGRRRLKRFAIYG